ncbi:hypothetical protein SASPL_150258 [Salvia splendens]|uniref:Myb/SANT-like domain-containing protein n=1 Tax=Salvia splendens TaxID=180675 RepID=A0A8X8W5S9_SALSN|nr:hypothetical protein SASPL_150258 [Salvia splendens]
MSEWRRAMVLGTANVVEVGQRDRPSRKFKKGDQTRRLWNHRKEEILGVTLVELVALGWKSDNGFRSRYLQRCEDSIRQEFPTTDIKRTPNIVSKITSWKNSYSSLRNILERSGVGFSVNGDYKIDIDDDQWEQVVQVRFEQTPPPDENDGDEDPLVAPNSSTNIDKPISGTKAGSSKWKASDSDGSLMVFLANLHAETNARLEAISTKIGYEFNIGLARHAVFKKLGGVDGLTLAQRYKLCNILSDKPQRLEFFNGMPPKARLGYALTLWKSSTKIWQSIVCFNLNSVVGSRIAATLRKASWTHMSYRREILVRFGHDEMAVYTVCSYECFWNKRIGDDFTLIDVYIHEV